MGMKIQAIQPDHLDFTVHVGGTYYVEDTGSELYGEFKVTSLEVIAAPTASGVEARAEIEVGNPNNAACRWYEISAECILEEPR